MERTEGRPAAFVAVSTNTRLEGPVRTYLPLCATPLRT